MAKQYDGKRNREWLRNYFASERELIFRLLARADGESAARDAMQNDEQILAAMSDNGISKSNIAYHRTVLKIPGTHARFRQYKNEYERANNGKNKDNDKQTRNNRTRT